MTKVKIVMEKLINGEGLVLKYGLHRLISDYKDRFECHIESELGDLSLKIFAEIFLPSCC